MTVIDEIKLEGRLETAEKMLGRGMTIADVLDVTGLKEEDLKGRGLIA